MTVCILLCSKPTKCFPSHSRVKAHDRTRPVVLALHELVCSYRSDFISSFSSPHALHTTHQGHLNSARPGAFPPQDLCLWYCHWNALPLSGDLISFGSLLKSASQQGPLWPLLKFHFPVSCCLSLPNHCLTFKTYFSSTIYHEKFQTHTKVERITW